VTELKGMPLGRHLDVIFSEIKAYDRIYGYPLKKVFRPDPRVDLGVDFHGQRAATPLGPAAGPHTQMAQNILLAFLGGSRIMELKTVQINDRLEIPRPCIDARNVCFNVEWSQELRLAESYDEYVKARLLLEILRREELLGVRADDRFYDFVFDMSVGYDLKGISSQAVTDWIKAMRHAAPTVDRLLDGLPDRYRRFKRLAIDPEISRTLTLFTFHGCPADEIESIVEYLIGDLDLDVIVKLNPTLLGFERVGRLLCDRLGYSHLGLDRADFDADLQFEQAVEMMGRLTRFASDRGRRVGAKFTNTLVVKNHDQVFDDPKMYLSGAPLHVISMNTMLELRRRVGPNMPISFSAGVDQFNFVDSVACGMVPVTVCTDLLRKGGYTRQVRYLRKLEKALLEQNCADIADYLRIRSGEPDEKEAGLANAAAIVPKLASNPRYLAEKNRKMPKKVGSQLELFDCLTCDICIPVCPNGANFSIPIPPVEQEVDRYRVESRRLVKNGRWTFQLNQKAQIGNLAEFCNECGNCDTFCPEDGGPYLIKPRFFAFAETFETMDHLDGFYLEHDNCLKARLDGVAFELSFEPERGQFRFHAPNLEAQLDSSLALIQSRVAEGLEGQDEDLFAFHALRVILQAVSSGDHQLKPFLSERFVEAT